MPVEMFRGDHIGPPLWFAALLAAAAFSGCPKAPQGPEIGALPLITTDDPQAEAEIRAAREAAEGGDKAGAEKRYRDFLAKYPADPLAPIAQLSLGRLLLDRNSLVEADALFTRVKKHEDQTVAEQGRFYAGVTAHRLGRHREAIEVLTPMVGRTIDPADTALLLKTLAAALSVEGDYAGAIRVLDTLAKEGVPERDRRAARHELEALARDKASAEEIEVLFRELPPDGAAWPHVARRAVRDADAARDVERTRTLLESMREHGLDPSQEVPEIALRAALPTEADPRVVGVILSLSGRARKVGELALRGVMLAAGLPPKGPLPPNAPQVVFRDDAGDPERALEALNELVTVHRAVAIIGPIDAHVAEAIAPRAQELGVPLITLTPGGKALSAGGMIFRMFPTPRSEVEALVAGARARGATQFAMLHPQNAYGEVMRDIYQAEVTRQGATVTSVQAYAPDATAFGPPIAELGAASFDALLVADSARKLALIAPALAAGDLWSTPKGGEHPRRGRGITLLAPSVGFSARLAHSVGRYLQGALFSSPFDAATASGDALEFSTRFEEQFGSQPETFAAFAYDSYRLVRTSVEAGSRSREALSAALVRARPKGLAGPGPGLSADRQALRPTRLLTLNGETFEPVTAD